MNQPAQNFFTRATLAEQQYRDVDIRYQRRLRSDLPHGWTRGDEEDVVCQLFDFSAESLLAAAQAEIDDSIELRFFEGLGQVVLRAEFHGLNNFARVVDAREHHDLHSRLFLAQLAQRLQTIDPRHEDIE